MRFLEAFSLCELEGECILDMPLAVRSMGKMLVSTMVNIFLTHEGIVRNFRFGQQFFCIYLEFQYSRQ